MIVIKIDKRLEVKPIKWSQGLNKRLQNEVLEFKDFEDEICNPLWRRYFHDYPMAQIRIGDGGIEVYNESSREYHDGSESECEATIPELVALLKSVIPELEKKYTKHRNKYGEQCEIVYAAKTGNVVKIQSILEIVSLDEALKGDGSMHSRYAVEAILFHPETDPDCVDVLCEYGLTKYLDHKCVGGWNYSEPFIGMTPLEAARSVNRDDLVEVLIKNGAIDDIEERRRKMVEDGENIEEAADKGQLERLQLILQDTEYDLSQEHCWAMHKACFNPNTIKLWRTLLRHGANVDERSADDETVLYRLVNHHGMFDDDYDIVENLERIRFLLDKGADPNAKRLLVKKDPDGGYAQQMLYYAVLNEDQRLFDLLIEYGAEKKMEADLLAPEDVWVRMGIDK